MRQNKQTAIVFHIPADLLYCALNTHGIFSVHPTFCRAKFIHFRLQKLKLAIIEQHPNGVLLVCPLRSVSKNLDHLFSRLVQRRAASKRDIIALLLLSLAHFCCLLPASKHDVIAPLFTLNVIVGDNVSVRHKEVVLEKHECLVRLVRISQLLHADEGTRTFVHLLTHVGAFERDSLLLIQRHHQSLFAFGCAASLIQYDLVKGYENVLIEREFALIPRFAQFLS